MTKIEYNGNTLELYSTIKEMPIERHNAMQVMLLHDSGIGSMADVDTRFSKVFQFASAGKTQEVVDELQNTRFNFFSALNKINYKSKSFACLVAKINGQVYDDITDSGLKAVTDKIEEMKMPQDEMENHFTEVKKKLIPNFQFTSPTTSEMI